MPANNTDDLVARLRARRDIRDHSANNGWRNVEAPAIEVEAANEIQTLRQRIVSAEVALAMFVVKKPRIDPRMMLQAYTMSYPEPMASPRSVEICVAAKESGELAGRGGRVS